MLLLEQHETFEQTIMQLYYSTKLINLIIFPASSEMEPNLNTLFTDRE